MLVFPDSGVLLAMIVFPRDRSGSLTLAGEVLELYEAGAFELVIGQAVVDELDEVLDERFPAYRPQAVSLLMPFADRLVRRPIPSEIVAVLPFCSDPSDAHLRLGHHRPAGHRVIQRFSGLSYPSSKSALETTQPLR